MDYSTRKISNGTQYMIVTEQIAVGLIRAQVFHPDSDYPVVYKEYQHSNLVTCNDAVWAEYKNKIRAAINAHNFKALNG